MEQDYSLECLNELKRSSKQIILVIDYWDANPHLETSLEICIRLSMAGKNIYYHHWGNQVPLVECASSGSRVNKAVRITNEYLESTGYKPIKTVPYEVKNIEVSDKWPEFEHTEEIRNYKWQGQPAGISVVSTLCDLLKTSSIDCRKANHVNLINRALTTFRISYELTLAALNLIDPDAVVLFNGRYPSYSASKYSAKSFGIPIFFHERGSDNQLFLFTRDMPHSVNEMNKRLAFTGKKILSRNLDFEIAYAQTWFKQRIVNNESDKENLRLLLRDCPTSQDSGLLIYSFFVTSNDEISSLPTDVYPEMYWSCQISAICDLASAITIYQPNAILVIRIHPNLVNKEDSEQERFEAIARMQNVILIRADAKNINSYALAEMSDFVFVYCSTIGIEAAQMNKKVYTMAPTYYDFLKVTTPIRSYNQLRELIESHQNSVNELMLLNQSLQFRCSIYGHLQKDSGIRYKYYDPKGNNSGLFLGKNLN